MKQIYHNNHRFIYISKQPVVGATVVGAWFCGKWDKRVKCGIDLVLLNTKTFSHDPLVAKCISPKNLRENLTFHEIFERETLLATTIVVAKGAVLIKNKLKLLELFGSQ